MRISIRKGSFLGALVLAVSALLENAAHAQFVGTAVDCVCYSCDFRAAGNPLRPITHMSSCIIQVDGDPRNPSLACLQANYTNVTNNDGTLAKVMGSCQPPGFSYSSYSSWSS